MNGKKVVIKRNKSTKLINEYLLIFTYSFISLILLHPTSPPRINNSILFNEGWDNRKMLNEIGISTPSLLEINNDLIIEEFVDGGNLYQYLKEGGNPLLAYEAGAMTGKLHNKGFSFLDNKAQNYLISGSHILRTDLSLIQKQCSVYSMSLDIGIFLASLLDLKKEMYIKIEKFFLDGYKANSIKSEIPHLSIILRNIASLALSSDHKNLVNNLLIKSKAI